MQANLGFFKFDLRKHAGLTLPSFCINVYAFSVLRDLRRSRRIAA